jgi:hypothetical protein
MNLQMAHVLSSFLPRLEEPGATLQHISRMLKNDVRCYTKQAQLGVMMRFFFDLIPGLMTIHLLLRVIKRNCSISKQIKIASG